VRTHTGGEKKGSRERDKSGHCSLGDLYSVNQIDLGSQSLKKGEGEPRNAALKIVWTLRCEEKVEREGVRTYVA